MRTCLALLVLTGILPVVQAQGAVLSPEAIVVNPVPAYEVEVSTQDLDGNTKTDFAVGEAIRVSVRVTEDAYVYLFDVRSDGSINQILPNNYDANGQNNFVRGGRDEVFSAARRTVQLYGGGPGRGRQGDCSRESDAARHLNPGNLSARTQTLPPPT